MCANLGNDTLTIGMTPSQEARVGSGLQHPLFHEEANHSGGVPLMFRRSALRSRNMQHSVSGKQKGSEPHE
jgi:hypothetical protein